MGVKALVFKVDCVINMLIFFLIKVTLKTTHDFNELYEVLTDCILQLESHSLRLYTMIISSTLNIKFKNSRSIFHLNYSGQLTLCNTSVILIPCRSNHMIVVFWIESLVAIVAPIEVGIFHFFELYDWEDEHEVEHSAEVVPLLVHIINLNSILIFLKIVVNRKHLAKEMTQPGEHVVIQIGIHLVVVVSPFEKAILEQGAVREDGGEVL